MTPTSAGALPPEHLCLQDVDYRRKAVSCSRERAGQGSRHAGLSGLDAVERPNRRTTTGASAPAAAGPAPRRRGSGPWTACAMTCNTSGAFGIHQFIHVCLARFNLAQRRLRNIAQGDLHAGIKLLHIERLTGDDAYPCHAGECRRVCRWRRCGDAHQPCHQIKVTGHSHRAACSVSACKPVSCRVMQAALA